LTTLREFISLCETHDKVIDVSDDFKHIVVWDKEQGIKVMHKC
jgi:hypothetical protein